MNEIKKLMEAIAKIDEDYYDRNLDVRAATNKIHQQMDEGMLDPKLVAEAALSYMSEAEVADMARANDWYGFNGEEDDFEESVETVGEAYDEEVDGPNPFGSDVEVLSQLVRELQKLERNTARVHNELSLPVSKERTDYAAVLLNEFGMTLTDITDLVEKYEDFA